MTGFGVAQVESSDVSCSAEVRSVNNRYLKISARLPESHSALERDIERIVRERIRRGTVSVSIRINRAHSEAHFQLNRRVLKGYIAQLREIHSEASDWFGHVLGLPGIVEEGPGHLDPAADWPIVQECLRAALEDMERMRFEEGAAMQQDLTACCREMETFVRQIEALSPQTVAGYRDRLHERLRTLLEDQGISIRPDDLVREVSIFAERADIAEELIRLRSHLAQFCDTMATATSQGRKLEFISQEMYRESNTIGSKANDVEISKLAVDLKTNVERIREIIQNVE
jgi:uncharacterized protein (TIGR00255 family)